MGRKQEKSQQNSLLRTLYTLMGLEAFFCVQKRPMGITKEEMGKAEVFHQQKFCGSSLMILDDALVLLVETWYVYEDWPLLLFSSCH